MHKRILLLILLVSFLKELVWIALVPLWHFPDEQAHFAEVAYVAETGKMPPYNSTADLTEEIKKSEELLGTERDNLGTNKFTYHPEYKISYTSSYVGLYEKQISRYAANPLYRIMTKKEAAHYPSFYYLILSYIYNIFYKSDLFIRVFTTRIFQIIFYLGTVFIAWEIGYLLFKKDKYLTASLSLLVSFQPMFSFVSAGINSDNIANFIFSLYIFILMKMLLEKINAQNLFLFILITIFTLYIKPQFIISIPLFLIIFSVLIAKFHLKKKFKITLIFLLWFDFFSWLKFLMTTQYVPAVINSLIRNSNKLALFPIYIVNFALPRAYHEVLPWYWGIYDWLGVTYPRYIHRIINIVLLLSIIGIIIKSGQFLILLKKNKEKLQSSHQAYLFMGLIALALFFGIYLYDWMLWQITNIHLGVQGRYFFPIIIIQMFFMLLGIIYLPLKTIKFNKYILAKMLVIGMVLLNFYALYTIASTYYEIKSLTIFITQASQYKPWFLKGDGLLIILSVYLISLVVLIKDYLHSNYASKKL